MSKSMAWESPYSPLLPEATNAFVINRLHLLFTTAAGVCAYAQHQITVDLITAGHENNTENGLLCIKVTGLIPHESLLLKKLSNPQVLTNFSSF